jgi:AcrR family transcriptional regulator
MIQNTNGNSEPLGRKERELAIRRSAILDAAQEIFETEGYINATMAQIAGRAEFGVGTIYQFFSSKQDLFAEVINQGMRRYMTGLNQTLIARGSWEEDLRTYIEFSLTWIEQRPEFHRLIYEIFYSPIPGIASKVFDQFKESQTQNLQFIREVFMRANTEGQRFDPDMMSLLIVGTVHAIGDSWFMGMLKKRPTEYIHSIFQLISGEVRCD